MNNKKNSTIPTWNLQTIYKNIDSSEYKKALSDYKTGLDEMESLLATANKIMESTAQNFDFPLWLSSYLKLANKTGALQENLGAYSYIIYSTDTTNKRYLDNMSVIDKMSLQSKKLDVLLGKILKENENQLSDFYKRFPEYEDYKYVIEEEISDFNHKMSAEQEELASDMQITGGDAWGKLHEQIISTIKDEETGKLFNELRNDAYSPDSNVRKSSWEKEKALLKQNEVAFAACLNNLKGETLMLNGRHGWKKALDRALASSRLNQKTLNALISVIEESLPEWRSYFQAKGKYLRKTKSTSDTSRTKGIAFYDIFAPINTESKNTKESLLTKNWTFNETRDYIIERFNSFSTDMGSFAKKVFDNNWIDAKVRSGKVGGAYDQDFPVQKESRILSNFTGAFNDVITLAHEIGHAYHYNCIKAKDYLLAGYPMTLAETASTFAETIVKQDVLQKSSKDERVKILELDLQDAAQVLVDILCRFYFEKSVFEQREKGELTAEDFCDLMKKAQEKSYGDGLNSNRHEYMWAVKSHYYSTGLDFYNFPYAFGQLFASGLYERYTKEGKDFVNVYKSLLEDTGRMSCEDLCLKAGFDITKKDFWRKGMKFYLNEIKEFVKLTSK